LILLRQPETAHLEQNDAVGLCPAPFDVAVPDSGYRWWYLDGISEDGQYGIVIIAFVGSVFSPYYFHARKRGPAPAENYVSINVCLYRPGGDRWAMTERGAPALDRNQYVFRLAGSQLAWKGERLVVEVAERTAPFARRIEGRIELVPRTLNWNTYSLEPEGRHFWRPIAPVADIEVEFRRPGLRWNGHGYMDSNFGTRMLECDFKTWDWNRSVEPAATRIFYVARLHGGEERRLGMQFDAHGTCTALPVPDTQELPLSGWRVRRQPANPSPVALERVLEDTPFYTRSVLRETNSGQRIVHESLDMDRFSAGWVRLLLPFRMPRLR
jgi:carotenoid 1,2-hydratase